MFKHHFLISLKTIENYFSRPSQYSIEVARIIFGVCSLIIFQVKELVISGKQVYESWNINNYYPKGILAIISPELPGIEWIDLCLSLQFLSAVLLIIGLFSRISLIINIFSNLILISLSESFTITWSHGFNLSLLAQMPFIFAPVGKQLSIDYYIYKFFYKREPVKSNNAMYLWMVNFSIVAIFLNAGFWKLFTTRNSISLQWALSDNLRNQIISCYSLYGKNIPEYLDLVVNTPWLYQLLALLNLFFQLSPFLSLFFLHKPLVRLFLGSFFAVEEIGLSIVMNLVDYHWLPLVLTFVDWDYFLFKNNSGPNNFKTSIFKNITNKVILAAYSIYIFAFLALAFELFYFTHGISLNRGQINSYPFSSYAMYSKLSITNHDGTFKRLSVAYKIYDKDLPLNADEIKNIEKHLMGVFNSYWTINDYTNAHASINFIKKYIRENFNVMVDSIEIQRVLYEYVPYPEPAGIKPFIQGTIIKNENNEYSFFNIEKINTDDKIEFNLTTNINIDKSLLRYYCYNYNSRKIDTLSTNTIISNKINEILFFCTLPDGTTVITN